MIPFGKIFKAIAIMCLVAGLLPGINDRVVGEILIKSGIMLWIVVVLLGAIHIPRVSRGTPLEMDP